MTLLALALDPDTADHLAVAVRAHRRSLARLGRAEPPQLLELEQVLLGVTRRQIASRAATLVDDLDNRGREWLTPREAAAVTGFSVRTIQRRISSGELASVRSGHARRVHRDAIADLLDPVKGDHG